MKKTTITITLLLTIILLVACTSSSQHEEIEKQKKLTVGVMSSMDYLPLALAKHNRYFDKYRIQVDLVKFFSANDRDAALQSGRLDGTILDYTGAAIQHHGGIALSLTSQCDGTFDMISNTNDLKGKKIAVSRNTVIDFCTDMFLKKNGWSQKDVEKIEINKIPLRLEMLKNNKIDATFLPDPFSTIAKQQEKLSAIISMNDLNYHVTGIVFTKNSIETKKETIQQFYQAYNEAITYIQTVPTSQLDSILIAEIGIPSAIVSSVKLPQYSLAKLPQSEDLNAVANWLKEKKIIKETYNIANLVDTTFILSVR